MKKLLPVLAAALAAVTAASAQPAQQPPGAPLGVEGAACRPTFTVGAQTIQAGTAFLTENAGKTYLVTAHHVFGRGGGLPEEIAWQDLPSRVTGMRCQVFISVRTWSATTPLAIPGAAPGQDLDTLNDIAAFPVQIDANSRRFVLKLASQPPKAGDTIWLLASLIRGAPPSQLLHKATVAKVGANGGLIFLFENPRVDIQATSGAAILNASGEVVGVNFGGGTRDGGAFGFATGLAPLRAALTPAK